MTLDAAGAAQPQQMRIGFLGGGNMGGALIGGLIARGYAPDAICVIDLNPAACERIASEYRVRVSTAPDAAFMEADTVVLAVKPQDMKSALASLGLTLDAKLVISIAAGIRLEVLSRWLGGNRRLIRCMPNTPALIGRGISGLYALPGVNDQERQRAQSVLQAVGEVIWVGDEALLDSVTAISGSGPAYVFWFIEQLAAGGVSLGLDEDASRRLAIATVLGSAELAARSTDAPAVLRERVTSKGGTTAAALEVFEREGLAERFRRALEAARRRGSELGDSLGRDD